MTSPSLSQAISEGDGISLIVPVDDLESARAAEADGAEGLLVTAERGGHPRCNGLRSSGTGRLAGQADRASRSAGGADDDDGGDVLRRARRTRPRVRRQGHGRGQLEAALERLDRRSSCSRRRTTSGEAAVERVLDLLEEVPAGKLAIAHLRHDARGDRRARADGVDAVIVGTHDIAGLAQVRRLRGLTSPRASGAARGSRSSPCSSVTAALRLVGIRYGLPFRC